MEKSIRHHFDIACGRLLLLEDENRKLKANQKETEQQCKNLKTNFQTLQGRKKELDEIKHLKDDMERQSHQIKSLEKNLQTLLSHKGDFIKEMKEQDCKQTANLETVRKDN
jgi:chromosome segregation ATPase